MSFSKVRNFSYKGDSPAQVVVCFKFPIHRKGENQVFKSVLSCNYFGKCHWGDRYSMHVIKSLGYACNTIVNVQSLWNPYENTNIWKNLLNYFLEDELYFTLARCPTNGKNYFIDSKHLETEDPKSINSLGMFGDYEARMATFYNASVLVMFTMYWLEDKQPITTINLTSKQIFVIRRRCEEGGVKCLGRGMKKYYEEHSSNMKREALQII
jgi:hypothetical protein